MIYFALGGKYVAIAHKEHCVTQLWFMSSLFILDYINNWPSVVSTNFGDNKFSLLVAVINTMLYLYPSMLAECSFVLFTLRAQVVFSNSSLLCISFWFFIPLRTLLGCVAATLIALLSFGCVAATLIACTLWGVLLPPLFYPRVHPTTFSPIYCQRLCILSWTT